MASSQPWSFAQGSVALPVRTAPAPAHICTSGHSNRGAWAGLAVSCRTTSASLLTQQKPAQPNSETGQSCRRLHHTGLLETEAQACQCCFLSSLCHPDKPAASSPACRPLASALRICSSPGCCSRAPSTVRPCSCSKGSWPGTPPMQLSCTCGDCPWRLVATSLRYVAYSDGDRLQCQHSVLALGLGQASRVISSSQPHPALDGCFLIQLNMQY